MVSGSSVSPAKVLPEPVIPGTMMRVGGCTLRCMKKPRIALMAAARISAGLAVGRAKGRAAGFGPCMASSAAPAAASSQGGVPSSGPSSEGSFRNIPPFRPGSRTRGRASGA